jgi:hypothetical protein
VLVLQLMISLKLTIEVPLKLPLYWIVKPVLSQRRMNGAPLVAQVVVPGSVTVNVPDTGVLVDAPAAPWAAIAAAARAAMATKPTIRNLPRRLMWFPFFG